MELFMPIMLVGLIAVMFFSSSRQRKRQKAVEEARNEMTIGDEIMTASGMFGVIVEIVQEHDVPTSQDRVVIEFEGSRTQWLRAAISKRIEPTVDNETETEHPAESQDVEGQDEPGSQAQVQD